MVCFMRMSCIFADEVLRFADRARRGETVAGDADFAAQYFSWNLLVMYSSRFTFRSFYWLSTFGWTLALFHSKPSLSHSFPYILSLSQPRKSSRSCWWGRRSQGVIIHSSCRLRLLVMYSSHFSFRSCYWLSLFAWTLAQSHCFPYILAICL